MGMTRLFCVTPSSQDDPSRGTPESSRQSSNKKRRRGGHGDRDLSWVLALRTFSVQSSSSSSSEESLDLEEVRLTARQVPPPQRRPFPNCYSQQRSTFSSPPPGRVISSAMAAKVSSKTFKSPLLAFPPHPHFAIPSRTDRMFSSPGPMQSSPRAIPPRDRFQPRFPLVSPLCSALPFCEPQVAALPQPLRVSPNSTYRQPPERQKVEVSTPSDWRASPIDYRFPPTPISPLASMITPFNLPTHQFRPIAQSSPCMSHKPTVLSSEPSVISSPQLYPPYRFRQSLETSQDSGSPPRSNMSLVKVVKVDKVGMSQKSLSKDKGHVLWRVPFTYREASHCSNREEEKAGGGESPCPSSRCQTNEAIQVSTLKSSMRNAFTVHPQCGGSHEAATEAPGCRLQKSTLQKRQKVSRRPKKLKASVGSKKLAKKQAPRHQASPTETPQDHSGTKEGGHSNEGPHPPSETLEERNAANSGGAPSPKEEAEAPPLKTSNLGPNHKDNMTTSISSQLVQRLGLPSVVSRPEQLAGRETGPLPPRAVAEKDCSAIEASATAAADSESVHEGDSLAGFNFIDDQQKKNPHAELTQTVSGSLIRDTLLLFSTPPHSVPLKDSFDASDSKTIPETPCIVNHLGAETPSTSELLSSVGDSENIMSELDEDEEAKALDTPKVDLKHGKGGVEDNQQKNLATTPSVCHVSSSEKTVRKDTEGTGTVHHITPLSFSQQGASIAHAHVIQLDVDDTLIPTTQLCEKDWLDKELCDLPAPYREKMILLDQRLIELFDLLYHMVVHEDGNLSSSSLSPHREADKPPTLENQRRQREEKAAKVSEVEETASASAQVTTPPMAAVGGGIHLSLLPLDGAQVPSLNLPSMWRPPTARDTIGGSARSCKANTPRGVSKLCFINNSNGSDTTREIASSSNEQDEPLRRRKTADCALAIRQKSPRIVQSQSAHYLLSVVIVTNATVSHIKSVFPRLLPSLTAFLESKNIQIDDLVCSARDLWSDEFPYDHFYDFWKCWTLEDVLTQLRQDGVKQITVLSIGDDDPERKAAAYVKQELPELVTGVKVVKLITRPDISEISAQLGFLIRRLRDYIECLSSFDISYRLDIEIKREDSIADATQKDGQSQKTTAERVVVHEVTQSSPPEPPNPFEAALIQFELKFEEFYGIFSKLKRLPTPLTRGPRSPNALPTVASPSFFDDGRKKADHPRKTVEGASSRLLPNDMLSFVNLHLSRLLPMHEAEVALLEKDCESLYNLISSSSCGVQLFSQQSRGSPLLSGADDDENFCESRSSTDNSNSSSATTSSCSSSSSGGQQKQEQQTQAGSSAESGPTKPQLLTNSHSPLEESINIFLGLTHNVVRFLLLYPAIFLEFTRRDHQVLTIIVVKSVVDALRALRGEAPLLWLAAHSRSSAVEGPSPDVSFDRISASSVASTTTSADHNAMDSTIQNQGGIVMSGNSAFCENSFSKTPAQPFAL